MSLQPRHNIRSAEIAVHGSIDYGELKRLGLKPEDVLDFSVNSNPFGPPEAVREAVARAAIDRYPDSECGHLRRRLAIRHGIGADHILVGNGSVDGIWAACLAYLGPGDSALICGPTFGEYEVASRVAGADVVKVEAAEEDGFRPKLERILDLISARRPSVVFLCNPNNPTGTYLPRSGVEEVLVACPEALVVLDEAYVGFVRHHWLSTDLLGYGNLLILRSMTKDFTLAGLRLGYCLAQPEIIAAIRKARPPWSVNAVAQEAGIAALSEEGFLEGCLDTILRCRDYLIQEFRRLGFPVVDSQANFFLVRVGDAARFRGELLSKGLLVRDCASFGLPEYVRVAPRRIEDCRRLVEEVERVRGRK